MTKSTNRYAQIIERIFLSHFRKGNREVEFKRDELEMVAHELGIKLPKNLGDVIYTFRYRGTLPASVSRTAPRGHCWIIRPAGRGVYRFVAVPEWDLIPNPLLSEIKVPDSTPGLIEMYALNDEQALLAKLRYNRLVDIFTGITCCSLQNHLRTTVPGLGQIETDEVYVGVDRGGAHYVFPIQAKGGKDKLNIVQIEQDLAMCAAKFSELICRPIGAQFMADAVIALFEFEPSGKGIALRVERHYRLVPSDSLSEEDLRDYRQKTDWAS